VFNGLGLCGDRTVGSGLFSVWSFRGDAARGGLALNDDNGTEVEGFAVFALKVVEGRRVAPHVVGGSGIVEASSIDGVGACDKRSPIWTVADDAIDESRRCRDAPGPNIAGGGARSLMS
jgi:hypothetical protein